MAIQTVYRMWKCTTRGRNFRVVWVLNLYGVCAYIHMANWSICMRNLLFTNNRMGQDIHLPHILCTSSSQAHHKGARGKIFSSKILVGKGNVELLMSVWTIVTTWWWNISEWWTKTVVIGRCSGFLVTGGSDQKVGQYSGPPLSSLCQLYQLLGWQAGWSRFHEASDQFTIRLPRIKMGQHYDWHLAWGEAFFFVSWIHENMTVEKREEGTTIILMKWVLI